MSGNQLTFEPGQTVKARELNGNRWHLATVVIVIDEGQSYLIHWDWSLNDNYPDEEVGADRIRAYPHILQRSARNRAPPRRYEDNGPSRRVRRRRRHHNHDDNNGGDNPQAGF